MAGRRPRLHRLVRWLIQLSFLGLFIFCFASAAYGRSPFLASLFFRFDPLLLLVVSLAGRAVVAGLLLSLVVVAGTLVFGRFFCGFVCPLGTAVDVADAAIGRPCGPGFSLRSGKYLTLLFLVVAALLGFSFAGFLDPLAVFERSLTLIARPVAGWVRGWFVSAPPARYAEALLAIASFSAILLLGLATPRFWCRNLCPLGGLLALVAKVSLFRFRFAAGCKQCGLCDKVCPTGAIRSEERRLDSGECIGCLACVYECPSRAIGYRAGPGPVRLDAGRRQALVTLGSAVLAVPLARSLLHARLTDRLIRPPGSIPEPEFLNACVHCGMCMKACPTNGLQPCVLESGVAGLWTPRLVPRVGGCEKGCNQCGRVCPTSAIRRLPLEEKSYAKLGSAVIDRARCIAWEQDRDCLICDEACQYDAITMISQPVNGVDLPRPFVDERICVGCGVCESRCPIAGPAAIQVYSIGEERRRTGSYITEEKRQLRACREKPEDLPSGFILE
ncbi:4Fe-4S binding protein [candidate division WOR-3 bacterium]|nr:4Fe-4S binding protein [candidate division WOR-3 bacterium]